jgi:hypothetical protein
MARIDFTTETNGFSIAVDGISTLLNGSYVSKLAPVNDTKFLVEVHGYGTQRPVYYNTFSITENQIFVAGVDMSANTVAEIITAIGSNVTTNGASGDPLPTETVATYAAMTTFISSDPTTKRDFFVSGEGVWYRYSGSGIPVPIGGARQIAASNVALVNTGNSTENTMFTAVVKGGTLGLNGRLDFMFLMSMTNNANNKFIKVRVNGTIIYSNAYSATAVNNTIFSLRNRGSATSQVMTPTFYNGTGNTTGTLQTFAFDTTQDITITVTLQNAQSADTSTLESFTVDAYG